MITSRAAEIVEIVPAHADRAVRQFGQPAGAAPFEIADHVGDPRRRVRAVRGLEPEAHVRRDRATGTNGGRAHQRGGTVRGDLADCGKPQVRSPEHRRRRSGTKRPRRASCLGRRGLVPTPGTVAWRRWPASPGEGGGSPWPRPPPTEVDNGASRAPP